MNLVLMPLWMLSGGFFPAPAIVPNTSVGQTVLGIAMRLNPLSYAVGGVRRLLAPAAEYAGAWVPGLAISWLVTLLFAAVAFALAVGISGERTSGDLQ
jgi:ABC-type multidrug transport system permease subunit